MEIKCDNKRNCPCIYDCPRHGKCCACVAHHRDHNEGVPGCFFRKKQKQLMIAVLKHWRKITVSFKERNKEFHKESQRIKLLDGNQWIIYNKIYPLVFFLYNHLRSRKGTLRSLGNLI